MNKVRFETNTPEQVTLRNAAGRIVDGRFGQQVMYNLVDGRLMYLDLGVAQKLNLLEVQAGETVNICKRGGGIWDVWLSPETETMRSARSAGSIEQRLRASIGEACETRYNTLRVPTPISAGASAVTPAPVAATSPSQGSRTSSTPNNQNLSNPLLDEANALVDIFAAVLARALTKHEGRIKPDEVRSLLLSCYISRSKNGGAANAAA